MKKVFKIGCLSVLGLFVLFIILAILLPDPPETEVEPAKQEPSLQQKRVVVPPVLKSPEEKKIEKKLKPPQKTPFELLVGKASLAVTAPELHKDYEANEFAADEKYKGKIVLVRGLISNMHTTLGSHYLNLDTGNFLLSISCEVQKRELPVLKQLSKKQDVVVVGEVTGVSFGSVSMKDCLVMATEAYNKLQKK